MPPSDRNYRGLVLVTSDQRLHLGQAGPPLVIVAADQPTLHSKSLPAGRVQTSSPSHWRLAESLVTGGWSSRWLLAKSLVTSRVTGC